MEIFQINGKIIEYTLEKKKIKNCYISVKEGNVIVRVPKNISKERIDEILLKRADWILEKVEEQKKKGFAQLEYVDGEKIRVLGKEVTLSVSYEKIQKPKSKFWMNQLKIVLPVECQNDSKKWVKKVVEEFYQELVEKEVARAMKKMTEKVGLNPNGYKIKNLKSTWGNCSSTRNISISKKVVMYSRHAIEYVCLHEICHLENMDHSKKFWEMVSKYMPDYKKAEAELKG